MYKPGENSKITFRFLSNCRLELHPDSGSTKTELVFMDCVEEVAGELLTVKNEQSVVIKMKDQSKVVITSSVSHDNEYIEQYANNDKLKILSLSDSIFYFLTGRDWFK